jgi:alpha-methylacyl-CoA racemase
MALADMGADVVKVEDPGAGDYLRRLPPLQGGMGGRYLAVNRNKRSLVLDLKSEPGREAFLRMAERADAVVESFRPGVLDRLGIGYGALRARNRGIVLCSISGYGQTGPYRERAGHDLNYLSLAGVLAMGGEADGRPGMPGVQIADLAGGALWGATALCAALVGRQRTGEGRHLDISMTDGALALLAAELGSGHAAGRAPTRGQSALSGGLASYSIYETADGRYLSVAALEPKFWSAFNQAIGRQASLSDLDPDPAIQTRVKDEVQAILSTRARDEWAELLAEADCCCEPVLEPEELEAHPLHAARKTFFTTAFADDGGELSAIPQVRTPVGEPAAPRPPPRHGEHSAQVLAEYGFSDDEIRALSGAS